LNEEQRVQSLEPRGIDREEIHRDDAAGLRTEERFAMTARAEPSGRVLSARSIFLTVVAETTPPRLFSSPTIR